MRYRIKTVKTNRYIYSFESTERLGVFTGEFACPYYNSLFEEEQAKRIVAFIKSTTPNFFFASDDEKFLLDAYLLQELKEEEVILENKKQLSLF